MPCKLEVADVAFTYDAYDTVPLLRKVSFTVKKGDVVIIGGKSGHGTSTLLELCVGLQMPKSGRVMWDDIDLKGLSLANLMNARQRIGYVFESCALISNFTAFDNIGLPLKNMRGLAEPEIRQRVRVLMEELGLFNIDTRYPEALSEWQGKATAVGRALINRPDMLFLDEPVSGLDPVTAQGILNVIEAHWKTEGFAIIMISHDLSLWPHIKALRLSLENGKLNALDLDPNAETYAAK
jgi:ABC-type methionine transport system ATPase subunit